MRETIEAVSLWDGGTITVRHIPIMPGVELQVYDEVESVLVIGKHAEVQLDWSEETRQLFKRRLEGVSAGIYLHF
ncbi:hypothetical protein [Paenibacillus sp. HGF5]|uniref:hypothetical protein n=1 Tax=Paenibacillus sp. HGF5 TaxID=908341 RepID=UPI0002072D64|nr:hypothetical protein [Paenibacillus sp. HGF5]EGG35211.1 conserved domain protein [Paenibacillus sp. HGF5]